MERDPRLAALDNIEPESPSPSAVSGTTVEEANLLTRAIPAEGTKEHAEYVIQLIDRIKKLEESSQTNTGFGGLPRILGLRVSPKGGVSVYGLNANFPVTLYPEQWHRLFEQAERVKDFIQANGDVLTLKEDSDPLKEQKENLRKKAGIVARPPLRMPNRAA